VFLDAEAIMAKLTHLDSEGRARMVDVSEKDVTTRIAAARGAVFMRAETLDLIRENKIEKGDVFSVARVAGIMAAKKTPDLVPMCHPLNITSVEIFLTPQQNPSRVEIEAVVKVDGKTGVEMEAMTAVSVCGLTIYDMCKAVDREMSIGQVRLVKKSGGKSGTFIRKE
jgi:cyclic pyranopterin phosphate synthase